MARKKRVARRAPRRTSRRRNNYRNSKTSIIKTKIMIVFNNLLLFVALALVSFVLYRFLQNDFLINLFQVMAMVFGFVSVGFLITLLVLFIMKIISKKR